MDDDELSSREGADPESSRQGRARPFRGAVYPGCVSTGCEPVGKRAERRRAEAHHGKHSRKTSDGKQHMLPFWPSASAASATGPTTRVTPRWRRGRTAASDRQSGLPGSIAEPERSHRLSDSRAPRNKRYQRGGDSRRSRTVREEEDRNKARQPASAISVRRLRRAADPDQRLDHYHKHPPLDCRPARRDPRDAAPKRVEQAQRHSTSAPGSQENTGRKPPRSRAVPSLSRAQAWSTPGPAAACRRSSAWTKRGSSIHLRFIDEHAVNHGDLPAVRRKLRRRS